MDDERLGRWVKLGLDGFALEPPPLSIPKLIFAVGGLTIIQGILVYWLLQADGGDGSVPWIVGGFTLLIAYLMLTGIRLAAVRTTVTVRGRNLQIQRTFFGLHTRTIDTTVFKTLVRPGKRRVRYGNHLIWIDLETPNGTYRVDLGDYSPQRAESLINSTIGLLDRAKKGAIDMPGEEDPNARQALDALRGRRTE